MAAQVLAGHRRRVHIDGHAPAAGRQGSLQPPGAPQPRRGTGIWVIHPTQTPTPGALGFGSSMLPTVQHQRHWDPECPSRPDSSTRGTGIWVIHPAQTPAPGHWDPDHPSHPESNTRGTGTQDAHPVQTLTLGSPGSGCPIPPTLQHQVHRDQGAHPTRAPRPRSSRARLPQCSLWDPPTPAAPPRYGREA